MEIRKNQKPKLELLAPAGSFETLKAVVNAGADAVYVGGSMFGARAYARNFSQEELLEAIEFCHIHNRKLFLTVNTLLKNQEINTSLYEYIRPYYEAGLDAVIVQDFGVFHFLREHFPLLPLHTSTQMTVTGTDGARLLKELGAERIVTARELSLPEIAEIHRQVDVEIESFIHGALCYSYSGQCLLSSILGGRSGNRGRCAQPCRLPYEVYDSAHNLLNKNKPYILSLKDLNTLEFLPEIAESGVYSLKIEGRMKSTRYAAGVVSVYRHYMDKYLTVGKENYSVTQEDAQKLFDFGNRNGFTKGYYFQQNGADMLTGETSSHSKADENDVQTHIADYMEKDLKEKIKGKLTLFKGKNAIIRVWDEQFAIEVEGDTVTQAQKRPLDQETVLEKLNKTGNTPFVFSEIKIEMEDDVFLPMTSINHMRQEALEALRQKHLSGYQREVEASFVPVFDYSNAFEAGKTEPQAFIVSTESEIGLKQALERKWVTDIYLDCILYQRENLPATLQEHVESCKKAGKRVFYMLPMIFRADTKRFFETVMEDLLATGLDGFVVRSYDELGFLLQYGVQENMIRMDANLYTFSDAAKAAFVTDTGILRDTVPVELNRGELFHRNNCLSDMIVYGRLPLMVSAGCVQKNTAGCKKKPGILYLKDRYDVEFPVRNICAECQNLIYNAKPLFLLHLTKDLQKVNPAGYRLHFTFETGQEIKCVLDFAEDVWMRGMNRRPEECMTDYTNGHFKRGVE